MDIDPDKALAALEQLEAEKRRRLEARVDSGEVLRVELAVVGERLEDATASIDAAKARKTEELRAAGERRPLDFDVIVVATGVPRHSDWRQMNAVRAAPPADTSSLLDPASKGTTSEPASEGPAPSSPEYICTTVSPATDEGDPGEIAEGFFQVSGGQVVVSNVEGEHIASRVLMKGQDGAALARQLLREARKPQTFTRPLDYRQTVV